MVRFLLNTTENWDEVKLHLRQMDEGKRQFVWYSVTKGSDREKIVNILKEHPQLDIITGTPIYFILACAKRVPLEDRMCMLKYIIPQESKDRVYWKGKQFGYTDAEIDWYWEEVARAQNNLGQNLKEMVEEYKHDNDK